MLENKNDCLGLAISIAVKAHSNQFDKAGKPYILHPLHLMNQLMFDVELACIAVMHDVIEDSDVTPQELIANGFSTRVVDALTCLTHIKGEDYLHDYIPKICKNYDAIRVKRKDLQHNADITRLKGVTAKDLNRIEKYHKAFIMLTEAKRNFV